MTDTRSETGGTGSTGSTGSGGTGGGANGGGRSRAAEAYESTRERTSAAYAGMRERAARAGRTAGEQIEANPMAAIAGGLAIGALLGALLPRSERETELLGSVGTRINETAREAARTAAEAGRQQVEEISETAATRVGEAVIGAVSSVAGDKGSGKS